MTEDTVYSDLLGNISEDGDFLGVIDSADTSLQVMYNAADDSYWTEIPDPERGGSFGAKLSFDQVTDLFKSLPDRFTGTIIPGAEFQSWK